MSKAGLYLNVARSIPGSFNRSEGSANKYGQTCHCPGHCASNADHFSLLCRRYDGDHRAKHFIFHYQGPCKAFPSTVAEIKLANANSVRDCRIHADFLQILISIALKLYVKESFGFELSKTLYVLDATTTDLCLSVPH